MVDFNSFKYLRILIHRVEYAKKIFFDTFEILIWVKMNLNKSNPKLQLGNLFNYKKFLSKETFYKNNS